MLQLGLHDWALDCIQFICQIVYDFNPGDGMPRGRSALAVAGLARPLPQGRSSAVYEGLRRAIIEQALLPGDKLPEDTIGETFGVSRTLVRGALTRLASEGLIEQQRNKGATVARPSLESAGDIFEVRRQLEDLVVQRLAGRLTAAQAAVLRTHVERERAVHGDGPESVRLAGEFHILLAEMTGNALLARFVSEAASHCSLILALYGRPHSSECAVSEHVQLIEALIGGRVDDARHLMTRHIGVVQERALIKPAPGGAKTLRNVLDGYAQQTRADLPVRRSTRKSTKGR
jgi:DNA-binding GntR family transcriptional regulator